MADIQQVGIKLMEAAFKLLTEAAFMLTVDVVIKLIVGIILIKEAAFMLKGVGVAFKLMEAAFMLIIDLYSDCLTL